MRHTITPVCEVLPTCTAGVRPESVTVSMLVSVVNLVLKALVEKLGT